MANLTNKDKNILESYLQMEEGHLLSFTHKSLGSFFEDYNIDIYDEVYTKGQKSGSKANKMRGFWTISDDQTVGHVLLGLIQRYDDDRKSNNHYSGESGYSEQARLKCINIANKLISENTRDSSELISESSAPVVKSLTDYLPEIFPELHGEQQYQSSIGKESIAIDALTKPSTVEEMSKQSARASFMDEMNDPMKMTNPFTQATPIDMPSLKAQMQDNANIIGEQYLAEQICIQPEMVEIKSLHNKSAKTEMNQYQQTSKQKVFIVHGHDETLRLNVENFIRKIGLDPIILMDQASAGDTIIEKLENHGEANYAIVLYTECDVGKGKNDSDLKARARQNVVFEHGYFIARLGRKNVAAIVAPGVEKPNDTSGIVYISTNEAWQITLVKELKKAGLIFNFEALFA